MARNTVFAEKSILASLLAIGVAGSAQAQGVGNIVGGSGATLTGGDDRIITYVVGGGSYERFGRSVTSAGNSEGPSWTYGPAPVNAPGSQAWLLGGGDDRQVVYVLPY